MTPFSNTCFILCWGAMQRPSDRRFFFCYRSLLRPRAQFPSVVILILNWLILLRSLMSFALSLGLKFDFLSNFNLCGNIFQWSWNTDFHSQFDDYEAFCQIRTKILRENWIAKFALITYWLIIPNIISFKRIFGQISQPQKR